MGTTATLHDLAAPIVAEHGLDLFDLELAGGVLRVTVDRDGGVDLDAVAAVTRALSRALDQEDPIASRYTLEVSSPGLERALRTPEHFAWAVGQRVSVKATPAFGGERRTTGVLVATDEAGVVVEGGDPPVATRLAYDEIERARTVFEWGPAPRPGKASEKRTEAS